MAAKGCDDFKMRVLPLDDVRSIPRGHRKPFSLLYLLLKGDFP